jgi:hypothetical protein
MYPRDTNITVSSVEIKANGHSFTDGVGRPFFWLGDTQWELFRRYNLEEVDLILKDRQQKGFSAIQVMLTGVGDGSGANLYGQVPWIGHDPARPNPAYFENVDRIVKLAGSLGLILVIGVFHQLQTAKITATNARAYAGWIARRYRDFPHLVWSSYPQARVEYLPVLDELAAGLQAGDQATHLICCHPDPSPASSNFLHSRNWLAFNCIQTFKEVQLIYPMVSEDYKLDPAKPVVMAEGAYENGWEYGFDVTPLWVRRQAYYTCLSGGYPSYGHNASWRWTEDWQEALNAPGARQMSMLVEVLTARKEWWRLVPDQSLFASPQNHGQIMNVAARVDSGEWALVYLASPQAVSIRMDRLQTRGPMQASWINPADGTPSTIKKPLNKKIALFKPPAGWEDALLLLEAREGA